MKLGVHLTQGAGMCALPGTAGLIELAAARESATARATAVLGRTRAEILTAKARVVEVDPLAVLELAALSLSIGVSRTDDELIYMARGVMSSPINTGFYAQAMRVAKVAESASDAFSTFNAAAARMGESINFTKHLMGGKTAWRSSTRSRKRTLTVAHPMAGRTAHVVLDDIVSEVKPKPTRTLSSSTRGWLVAALGPGNGRAPV